MNPLALGPATLTAAIPCFLGAVPFACARATGVEITTGSSAWDLTVEEEPAAVLLLSEKPLQAVDTVFQRAGQKAALKPSRVYLLEFLVQPDKGHRQGFLLGETSGGRKGAFRIQAVKDPEPPRSVLYTFLVTDLAMLDFVKLESFTRIALP